MTRRRHRMAKDCGQEVTPAVQHGVQLLYGRSVSDCLRRHVAFGSKIFFILTLSCNTVAGRGGGESKVDIYKVWAKLQWRRGVEKFYLVWRTFKLEVPGTTQDAILTFTLGNRFMTLSVTQLEPWARIFSPFVCMEKTCGLMKICASLWSPLVSFSFLYVILPLFLSHIIISWDVLNFLFIYI
jgi:hypothetical protein